MKGLPITLLCIAVVLVSVGLSTAIFFLKDLSIQNTVWGNGELQVERSAQVGEFIGGVIGTIFALAGFMIVLLTYLDQVRSNEKEKIENRFYILLKIHIDNSNSITYHNPYNA